MIPHLSKTKKMNQEKIYLYWDHIRELADNVKDEHGITFASKVWGVPRGGIIPAAMMGEVVDDPIEADFIIDDIIDSGATRDRYRKLYPNTPFVALINKQDPVTKFDHHDGWIIFPWETSEADDEPETVEDNVRRILQFLGEDLSREGLIETPKRYIKALKEFTSPPEFKMTTFEADSDELVLVSGIEFQSMCEHHMFPFYGHAHIGYIPADKMVGISKIPRTVEMFSRRLQNQERITTQIADFLEQKLDAAGVIVILEAKHMCMCMRGVRKDAMTKTSAVRGLFKKDAALRSEFLSLISK